MQASTSVIVIFVVWMSVKSKKKNDTISIHVSRDGVCCVHVSIFLLLVAYVYIKKEKKRRKKKMLFMFIIFVIVGIIVGMFINYYFGKMLFAPDVKEQDVSNVWENINDDKKQEEELFSD